MLVLGIETSCDETSVSVTEDDVDIISNKVASSLEFHRQYGGVVPEIACRHHLECINFVIDDALNQAGKKLSDIDLVAITHGPGLTGALLVGLSAAKALSYSLKIPMIGVNHLYAHIYSSLIHAKNIEFPCIGFIVSGGHTTLVLLSDYKKVRLLGQTRDDAAGEAFDKAAKIMGLGYPGGPVIEKQADSGNPDAIKFPRAYLEKGSYDFSFSGVKTSLLNYVTNSQQPTANNLNDICASFQKAIFDVLVDKSISACINNNAKQMFAGGGVINNNTLRKSLLKKAAKNKIQVFLPDKTLCTDNAAMVAAAGYRLYNEGIRGDYSLDAEPNLALG